MNKLARHLFTCNRTCECVALYCGQSRLRYYLYIKDALGTAASSSSELKAISHLEPPPTLTVDHCLPVHVETKNQMRKS